MVSGRTLRYASIVVAGTLSMAALGCNLIAGLQVGGKDRQRADNPGPTEMTIKGTALFPGTQNAAEFVAIPGTKVEILDLRTGNAIQTGNADASGKFAIKISVATKPGETVVGIRAKATRSTAYRIAAAGGLEVSGLAGLVEARVDPATTVAAAKILEQAKTSREAVKVDLAKFETLVQKVKALLTPELIASVTSGGTSGTAAFDTLVATDSTLEALADTVVAVPAPATTAIAAPTPTASSTASATAAPTASPTASATAAPTASPTASATAAPTASPTASATATPTAPPASPTPVPTPTPTPTAIPLLPDNTVTILSSGFSPSVFRVVSGTTITVINQGGLHTLESTDGTFSTGDTTFGDSKSLTLNKPGTYSIKCKYHGSFSGTVQVE